ncbi:N-acyl-D-glucosamine 2-epimerase [Paenibacillus allorhizosphaerae]|uniref:N-acyl-D-glucosamine 2-epimerase n=1 Tax=Paenibacillus allorhizosphaerae TaxID=2849866 RepID=A0ABN7TH96_9BACL|nr:N-acyl-D-glucosamine 2-epimerase [Paenibacillus allorhizosphaerae]CAG7628649.1 hypothetical protein PAECIP111802_01480 [Paenibacillus allorhizosphaerae]
MFEPLGIEPTIQIDPTFEYYKNRSEESVALELELAGYRNVRYFVTDETRVNGRLVSALRERGMNVWAMVLGNGSYTAGHLPPDWKQWQMTLLKPVNDGYFRFSPFSRRYVAWKKAACADLVRRYPFTGFEVAEPYFPEWNGLSSGVYGDVGPYARAAFKRFSGGEMPEFRYSASPLYYKKDRARYLLWIEFRVQAVNGFLHELINSPGGVRDARPDISIATWSLAVDAGRDPVDAVREFQGIDAAEMIRLVRPDLHVLQTHWPDWMRAKLPPDYVKHYDPFVRQIRASHGVIPLGVQTDIGSLRPMRRSREWLKRFASAADRSGYRMWTAYEYSIGLPMYTEPPVPLFAHRMDRERVLLAFNKRVEEASAGEAGHYRIAAPDAHAKQAPIDIDACYVDGNAVILTSSRWPEQSFELELSGIRDTPERWLLKGERANVTPSDTRVSVPAAE